MNFCASQSLWDAVTGTPGQRIDRILINEAAVTSSFPLTFKEINQKGRCAVDQPRCTLFQEILERVAACQIAFSKCYVLYLRHLETKDDSLLLIHLC